MVLLLAVLLADDSFAVELGPDIHPFIWAMDKIRDAKADDDAFTITWAAFSILFIGSYMSTFYAKMLNKNEKKNCETAPLYYTYTYTKWTLIIYNLYRYKLYQFYFTLPFINYIES